LVSHCHSQCIVLPPHWLPYPPRLALGFLRPGPIYKVSLMFALVLMPWSLSVT
jgi:hypothetical protein